MSEYSGSPAFGSGACHRCKRDVASEMWWAHFRVNGELIGNICENCRLAVMADYIIPCAYFDDKKDCHTVAPDPSSEDQP